MVEKIQKYSIEQMLTNDEIDKLQAECLSMSSEKTGKYFFVKSDNKFTRTARILQAIRRYESGAKGGFFTQKGIKHFHPNLSLEGEKLGCNFLDYSIFEYAKSRVMNKKKYETINADRLFNNFLSSQPMAFNLFCPLQKIVESEDGQRQLAEIIRNIVDEENRLKIDRITRVGIEFIPEYYMDCLNDKTAMDACLRYTTLDGRKGLIAIETKYTDSLGTNQASNPDRAKEIATNCAEVSKIFTKEGKKQIENGKLQLSQLYRNFLLTETVRWHEHLDDSMSIVIAPKRNTSNKKEKAELMNIIKDEYKYKFKSIDLEAFVSGLISQFPNNDIFKKFEKRYLDFELAERVENRLYPMSEK